MRFDARLLVAVFGSVVLAFAQAGGGGGGTGSGGSTGGSGGSTGGGAPGGVGAPGGGGGGITGPGSFPGQRQPGQQYPFPQMDRQMPIFLSGKVVLDDGSPLPEPATIERICNGGQPRPEGYTDSKGRFSIQLGNNMAAMPDASVSNATDISDITGVRGGSTGALPGQQRGFSERDLMGCEIRASLPGYRSQVISLAGRRLMDNPDIGTILMKRLGKVEGLTTSLTSLEAPKEAKKAYEKALNLAKKNKPEEAIAELRRAVAQYDRYAAAWYELGYLLERTQRPAEAREAYEKSLAADARFVKPYLQLAGLFLQEQKWQEVVDTTDRVIKLNPYDYPGAYFYNSVANLNLQRLDAAEKAAREGIKQDEYHRIPKLEHVLGVVLAQKNDFEGAAQHMKAYLQFAPKAQDADFVRKQLAEVEKLTAQNAPAAPEAVKPQE